MGVGSVFIRYAAVLTCAPSRICVLGTESQVVVKHDRRRAGVGRALLLSYLTQVYKASPQLAGVLLLCKRPLAAFYERAGFKVVGPSDVVHGQEQWLECELVWPQ